MGDTTSLPAGNTDYTIEVWGAKGVGDGGEGVVEGGGGEGLSGGEGGSLRTTTARIPSGASACGAGWEGRSRIGSNWRAAHH